MGRTKSLVPREAKPKPPSHRPVLCYYCKNPVEIRADHLPRHTFSVHGSVVLPRTLNQKYKQTTLTKFVIRSPRPALEENSEEMGVADEVAEEATQFEAAPNLNNGTISEDTAITPRASSLDDDNDGEFALSFDQDVNDEAGNPSGSPDDVFTDLEPLQIPSRSDSVQPRHRSNSATSNSALSSRSRFSSVTDLSLHEKVDDLLVLVRNMQLTSQTAHVSLKSASSPFPDDNQQRTLIMKTRSVVEMLKFASPFSLVDTDRKKIFVCPLCTDDGRLPVNEGYINYNFSSGTDFSVIPQHEDFRNLKKKICAHLQSETHKNNEMKMENEELSKLERRKKVTTIGLLLARLILTNVRHAIPYTFYEHQVATLAASGVKVGDINHGRKFAAFFTTTLYETLKERWLSLLETPIPATGSPTPVAILGDKMTAKRRTGQIMAIGAFIQNKLQAIFVESTVVKDHTGLGLTRSILEVLERVFNFDKEKLKKRLTAIAFDGQYVNLNVEEHLLNELNRSPWLTATWDPAHRIELGVEDARTDKEWVTNTTTTITEVLKQVARGKAYEELLNYAKEANEDLAK